VGPEVFVDTGAWIAIAVAEDQYHEAAVEVHRRLLHQGLALVTTNLVIAESYVAIRRVGGHQPAVRYLQSIRESSRLVKLYSDATMEARADETLAQYHDQDFSFVDTVSFAVIRQRGIAEAFAFDHHFLTAGFVLMPASR
jgi:predicted nucleic acid-binding protein